jgi:hypothetical protein
MSTLQTNMMKKISSFIGNNSISIAAIMIYHGFAYVVVLYDDKHIGYKVDMEDNEGNEFSIKEIDVEDVKKVITTGITMPIRNR